MVLIWLIEDERYENYEFPSPCGDYGSYQLRLSSATTIAPGKSFRPLAGIMVLINYDRRRSMLENMSFPSPCGDYGSYQIGFQESVGGHWHVSVPLRGLWFLSERVSFTNRKQLTAFPSPCGDYGSYLVVETTDGHRFGCFRPLAGIMVLIFMGKRIICIDEKDVSVPLRGLWFLSR